jgi:uncharacterized membrane protein
MLKFGCLEFLHSAPPAILVSVVLPEGVTERIKTGQR